MSASLKALKDQVIVITGASSGIGLATAESAASQGAKVVIAARSSATLREVADRLNAAGGNVMSYTCDVSQRTQIDGLVEAVITHHGRIDTWVNNAALGIYARLDEGGESDSRRLFDINFWGVVHGSLAVLPYLKKSGGALINVGSEVSEAAAPLLGIYTATKHAVKGFTDVLRVEIEELDKSPVSITLIQPTAVDTPFPQHARNYLPHEPKLPAPMIQPQHVADAILAAAVTPTRSKDVGVKAMLSTVIASVFPSYGDKLSASQANQLQSDEAPRSPLGALYDSSETLGVAGMTHGTGGREFKA